MANILAIGTISFVFDKYNNSFANGLATLVAKVVAKIVTTKLYILLFNKISQYLGNNSTKRIQQQIIIIFCSEFLGQSII